LGDGPRDIVLTFAVLSNLDVFWELPENAEFMEELARLGRVIVFDRRGAGLSDRQLEDLSAEQRSDDMVAVMDAAGSTEAVLFGWLDAGSLALLTAARHPGKVTAVIAGEVLATWRPDADHPYGLNPTLGVSLKEAIEADGWGRGLILQMMSADVASSPSQLAWWRKYESMSATPSAVVRLFESAFDIDVRAQLPSVRSPVLLIHDLAYPLVPVEGIQWLADQLPSSSLRILQSASPLRSMFPVEGMLVEIEEFLAGTHVGRNRERQVATLLFTDIVGSTATASSGGDRAWRRVLDAHREAVRRSLSRYGGSEVDTAGDGFLASFTLPSSALACALDVMADGQAMGIPIRAGLHTGEVLVKPPNVTGIAVHVAARVAAMAGPYEILLTDTVQALVLGSGIAFEPAGEQVLKGVPGRWSLHRLIVPGVPRP
jgi:class 3 adenylate cyclase/pimeloyl-ACP methyl ester carboxylesterase